MKVKNREPILKSVEQSIKKALINKSIPNQLQQMNPEVFDTDMSKRMFVVNEVNLINRSKRLLIA